MVRVSGEWHSYLGDTCTHCYCSVMVSRSFQWTELEDLICMCVVNPYWIHLIETQPHRVFLHLSQFSVCTFMLSENPYLLKCIQNNIGNLESLNQYLYQQPFSVKFIIYLLLAHSLLNYYSQSIVFWRCRKYFFFVILSVYRFILFVFKFRFFFFNIKVGFILLNSLIFFFYVVILVREWRGEREERNISLFYLLMHSLVYSYMCPDWNPTCNLGIWGWGCSNQLSCLAWSFKFRFLKKSFSFNF